MLFYVKEKGAVSEMFCFQIFLGSTLSVHDPGLLVLLLVFH